MASAAKLPKYTKQYNFDSPHRQEFSMPGSFMQYLNQNWSVAVYEKLIQSCKYFYSCHQIIPIEILDSVDLDYDEGNCNLVKDGVSIDLKKCKVWVYGYIRNSDKSPPYLVSSFLKHVYRCTPTSLWICRQDIEIEDFAKISTNLKHIEFYDITFFYPDKTEASLLDILTTMPKLEECSVILEDKTCIVSSTESTTIPVLSNLKSFDFSPFPKNDFPMLAEFIKLHPNTKFEIEIEQDEEIDVKAFKTMLKETFPSTTITHDGDATWCEFQWTLESQYVRVELSISFISFVNNF